MDSNGGGCQLQDNVASRVCLLSPLLINSSSICSLNRIIRQTTARAVVGYFPTIFVVGIVLFIWEYQTSEDGIGMSN